MTSLLTLGGAKFERLSVFVTFFFVCENNASFGIGMQFSELPEDMVVSSKTETYAVFMAPLKACRYLRFDKCRIRPWNTRVWAHVFSSFAFKSALHRCTLVDHVTPQRYGREWENTCTMESFRYFCIQKCVRDNKRYCTTLVRINATRAMWSYARTL